MLPEKKYLQASQENLPFFNALASKTRLDMIALLGNKEMSITELSKALGISSAITTRHIKILEDAGIVESSSQTGVHGLRKVCRLCMNEAEVILNNNYEKSRDIEFTEIEIPLGSYCSYHIKAPCGLATRDNIFGRIDDPRYFSALDRTDLALIWFTSGYLCYNVPTYNLDLKRVCEAEITFEICSEYPGYNNSYKSDINFYLNDKLLGEWISPGDFGGRKGKYTPSWWNLGTEYGLYKKISLTREGVYLDGIRISEKPLSYFIQPDEQIIFKIECSQNTAHPGGCNIFGRSFGDFDQGLLFKFFYGVR